MPIGLIPKVPGLLSLSANQICQGIAEIGTFILGISVISILKRNSISILIPFFNNNFISVSDFYFTKNS